MGLKAFQIEEEIMVLSQQRILYVYRLEKNEGYEMILEMEGRGRAKGSKERHDVIYLKITPNALWRIDYRSQSRNSETNQKVFEVVWMTDDGGLD